MAIKNIEQIIDLGRVMLVGTSTQARGSKLLIDLANELLPEKSEPAPKTASLTEITNTGATTVREGLPVPGKPAPPVPGKPAPPVPGKPAPPVTPAQPVVAAAPVTVTPILAAAPTPTPVAAPVATAVKSDQEMNDVLITEFKRLGGREKIDDVLTSLGITGVTGLAADVQQKLILAVQAIQL